MNDSVNKENGKQLLIVIILQIVFIILLFVNGMFTVNITSFLGDPRDWTTKKVICSCLENANYYVEACMIPLNLLIISVVTSITIMCFILFKENFKNKKYFSLINILSIILFYIMKIMARAGVSHSTYFYGASPYVLFYIDLIILIVATAISLYINYSVVYNHREKDNE